MATYIRSNEVNDIFQLDNEDYVGFPRTMEFSEQDAEEFFKN